MTTDISGPPRPSLPLWNPGRMTRHISKGAIHKCLDAATRSELVALPDLPAKVEGALKDPKPLDICMPVLNAVLAAQYYEIIQALKPPQTMRIYEPCVGASVPVILAAEAYGHGKSDYTAINLNRKLREQLRLKIAHLKTPIRIIEDHAQHALAHLAPQSFDLACFHHAVNDILQQPVAEPRGRDTTRIDWFPTERQMIEWLAEDVQAGRLDSRGKPELMQIVSDAVRLIRAGGHLVFDHFNWCKFIGVSWFPWDLFYNMIPITRRWIAESSLPLLEVRFAGVDPQWWMILQVHASRSSAN